MNPESNRRCFRCLSHFSLAPWLKVVVWDGSGIDRSHLQLKLSSGKPDCLTPVQARDPWRGHSNETITNTNPQIDRVQARPVLES